MAEEQAEPQEVPPPYCNLAAAESAKSGDTKEVEKGFPSQTGYPPKGYPPGPPQGYPPQAYPPQGYPPQGYPPQAYPPQGYPPQGYPPQGYPPQGYTPQHASNVVIVGQPTVPAAPQTVKVERPPRANDFLIFSVVLIAICCFHGNILSVLLTVPALLCSLVAQDFNKTGNYQSAKHCGYMALGCNIAVIAWYVVEWIIAIIVMAVVFSAGSTSYYSSCTNRCGYYGTNGAYTCTYRC